MILVVEMTPQIKHHLTANRNMKKKEILLGNFLGGLAWGVGSVVGASIIVGILGYVLKALGVFTSIGNFFGQFGNPGQ
ncbi:MAG: DUF5665 domain-containing protein [Candidatus Daviesbacteria bacterium]